MQDNLCDLSFPLDSPYLYIYTYKYIYIYICTYMHTRVCVCVYMCVCVCVYVCSLATAVIGQVKVFKMLKMLHFHIC